jgi:mono/diheme cytochrome c family protein
MPPDSPNQARQPGPTMKRAVLNRLAVAALIVGSALPALPAWAQEPNVGKIEYQWSCVACHGVDGKGTGPLAKVLKTKPADLTTIAKRNNGVFPTNRVYETIDGRQEVESHGPRAMPVWGLRYDPSPFQWFGRTAPHYPALDPEAIIRGRILALVDYLNRIQEK